jgi:hypothetical protein
LAATLTVFIVVVLLCVHVIVAAIVVVLFLLLLLPLLLLFLFCPIVGLGLVPESGASGRPHRVCTSEAFPRAWVSAWRQI